MTRMTGEMNFLRTSKSGGELDEFRFRRGIALLESRAGKIPAGALWLDLGCNQGQFLELVVRDHRVKGVGFDDWNAGLKTPGRVDWQYIQANLDKDLPWDEPADFISALEVLEHMIDTDGMLSRMHDALKPGGWLLLSTPNINCLRNRLTVPFGAYPTGLEYRNVIHHVRLYNVATLREHLHEHGFGNISFAGVSFLPLALEMGTGGVSSALADAFPGLCNNMIVVAQRP
jgi:2-polyprenyl-3-methyl-5-hydroxy-6-metoxy-1,4-benzoquinol methylase